MTTVAEWMTADPVLIRNDAPLSAAAERMVKHRFRHLPVVAPDGRLVGLLDDAGVFGRGELTAAGFVTHDARDAHLQVADVALTEPLVAQPDDDVRDVLRAMIDTGHEAVIVLAPKRRPVGILTSHDAVRVAPGVLPPGLDTRALATAPAITVQRRQTVGAALDTMRAHHLRHLVVVDDRHPWAVISWRTLVELDAAVRRTLPLDTLKPAAVETIPVGSSLYDVAERMVVQKVGCLPTVDDAGHVVGVITRTDVLKLLVAYWRRG